MPRLSVIIPTFNREQLVRFSIDSVLHQTYQDIEVIVVDDGSTDNTQQVLAAYGDKIRIIRQDNSGVSEALNKGIRAAQGEWISFLGSDDEWMPEYLELQMQRVDQHPEIITHITNAVTVQLDETKEDLFQSTRLTEKFGKNECILLKRPLRTIIDHRPWFCQAMVMRRELLFKVGLFDPTLTIAEDLDIVAKMALRGPFSICRKVLVNVFRRKEAIDNLVAQAKKKGLDTYRSFGKVYTNLLGYPGLNRAEKMAINRALSHNRRALGNVLVIAGRKPEARKYYIRSFFLYPSMRSLIKSIATFFPREISVSLIRDGKHILPGEDTDKTKH
jgi:glycosyltransferase involved in cell wall biosynthesis